MPGPELGLTDIAVEGPVSIRAESNFSREAYEAVPLGKVSPRDRLLAGGTDGDLANLVRDAQRVGGEFAGTVKVTDAVARVTGTSYQLARAGYGAAALTGTFSAAMDATDSGFAPWKKLQEKWTHEVGSPW